MVKIELGDQSFALPENWPDVIASGRYLDLIAILTSTPSSMAGRSTLIAERVVKMYAGDKLAKARFPEGIVVSAAMKIVDEVYPILDFILATTNPDGRPLLLVDNPLPEIKHNGTTYRGKGQYMMPMSGMEMEECSWAYSEYEKTGDINMLDKVIAMLYEPIGRKKLTIEQRQKEMHSLPPITKMGIKFWYESCESWWYHTYQSLYEGGGTEEKDSLGVSRLIRAIAGPKRGTVDNVRKMSRDEIYFELSELNREYKPKA